MKILAVDDNPDNLQLIEDIVEGMEHDVLKAYDGLQALEMVNQVKPDLILLDVNMPGMTGFEVLEHLKSHEQTAGIPVILLTALADVDYRVEGFDLGAEDYLVKPFSPLELIARIEARLRAKVTNDGLRERQAIIRQTFERFVAPSVVERLLRDPGGVQLGGKNQEVTVFFADIEGFTRISEHTDPEILLTVLNHYHLLVVDVVQSNGGIVDKFMGDAVMALFNTPLEQHDHALRAVQSACQIQSVLPSFHQQFAEEFQLKINFGIHTGLAVVGNVGTPQIMAYTAVGDTVNVASRLQDQAQNGQILVSETTYRMVQEAIAGEAIGLKHLKNRREPVMTYSVMWESIAPEV